jgi:MurNAc alpha-1-phosphate uridylyltransferase
MSLNPSDLNAFILAAGEGRRLRPYTDTLPKPLVPVAGKPILAHTFTHLKNAGIPGTTVNICYKKDILREFLGSIEDINITISEEEELYDTGYGIKRALHTMADKPFFAINGDAFWTDGPDDSTLHRLAATWDADKMDILLLLQPVDQMKLTHGVGDYDIDHQGRAIRRKDQGGAYMFAGLRIAAPKIFDHTPDEAFSFLKLMDCAEEQGRLYGLVHDGDWHHISTADDLNRVNDALRDQAA